MRPAGDPIRFGWEIAAATLARAPGPERLVTHWFLTEADDRVNADDHFGSNDRTLRFLAVALPTLMDQLGASHGVVVVPWDLGGDGTRLGSLTEATLSVVALGWQRETRHATRRITRVGAAGDGGSADDGAAADARSAGGEAADGGSAGGEAPDGGSADGGAGSHVSRAVGGPPFWRLSEDELPTPAPVAAVVAGLAAR